MKKIFAVAALFACVVAANAQQMGAIGGMTSSSIDGGKSDSKNIMLYHAGVVWKADLGAGFAIQPVLTYQVKGADLKQNNDVQSRTGYAEFGFGAQWGLDLLAFRPFVFAEPFVGYAVTGKEKLLISGTGTTSESINKALAEAKNKLEYGFGVGAGLEITSHIQLSCQWFKNLGTLYKDGELNTGDLQDIKSSYNNLKNYSGIKFSLAILF